MKKTSKPGAHEARPYIGSLIFVGAWLVHALPAATAGKIIRRDCRRAAASCAILHTMA